MKQVIFLAFILAALAAGAQSGRSIHSIANLQAKKTIVRQWNQDCAIVYADDGTQTFCLMDYQGNTFRMAPVPITIDVNDFEIYKDKVYFCGREASYSFAGYFDINDLFAGTDCYHFLPLAPEILNPLKLDLAPVADGLHLIVVGESAPMQLDPTHFIADIPFDLSGNCSNYLYAVEPEGVDLFDDVAVLEKSVAVIDHKSGQGHYMRVFKRPVSISDHIFTPATSGSVVFSRGDYFYHPISQFHITRLNDTSYATICYAGANRSDYGIALSVYSSTAANSATLHSRTLIRLGSRLNPQFEIKGISYNPVAQKLFILANYDDAILPNTYMPSCLYEIDLPVPGFTPGPIALTSYDEKDAWDAIANWNGAATTTICSGLRLLSNLTSLMKYAPASPTCLPIMQLPIIDIYCNDNQNQNYLSYSFSKTQPIQYWPIITTNGIIPICE